MCGDHIFGERVVELGDCDVRHLVAVELIRIHVAAGRRIYPPAVVVFEDSSDERPASDAVISSLLLEALAGLPLADVDRRAACW